MPLRRRMILAMAVLPLAMSCAITPEKWPHEPFTPEAWKAASWEDRYVYYESLAESRLLDGATRERVIELLGTPNAKNRPDTIAYLVRKRPLSICDVRVFDIRVIPDGCSDVRVLDIRLTPAGRVERYFIRGT